MSDWEDRIESKLDKVADSVSSINVTLAAQHESLKDHMRRTELLEQTVGPLAAKDNQRIGAKKLLLLLGSAIVGVATIAAGVAEALKALGL